ncbi:Inclusion body protein [Bordetella sputigena]|uniref:hypothetical protein n=1 Tax=Bordetella sputigena TaxID=1416810 RepID=UPI0039F13DCB
MANPASTDCDIHIRILIDDNEIQDGSVAGVYIVDNQVSEGSGAQGSASLNTVADTNDKICWRVEPLNPASKSTFQIQSISSIQAWGFTGTPAIAPDSDAGPVVFTGIAEQACSALGYTVDIFAQLENGDVMTLSPKPSIVVR